MNEKQARQWFEDALLRAHPNFKRPNAVDNLFPQQKAFFTDKARFKTAICSRRAGKTWTGSIGLLEAAHNNPNTLNPYIALTRESAKRIIWNMLDEHNRKYGYEIQFSEYNLTATLPNQSQIFCVGADQKNFIKRLRGTKYKRVIIDEGQGFASNLLQELVDDVMSPALTDLDGDLWLLGTPGPSPAGYFYEATTDSNAWSKHHWTIFDNEAIPNARSFLDELIDRNNWNEDHPTVQREWFGRWVSDPGALIYRFQKKRNMFELIPDGHWDYAIGVDYGWHDKTAFSVVAYTTDHPKCYVVFAKSYGKMIPSAIAAYLKKLVHDYPNPRIVCDTGGLGLSITEELRIRYGIPVEAAEKSEKLTFIELLNGDFINGNVFVHKKCYELMHEYETLIRDDKGREDENLPNDLCDATLYAYREAKHYAYTKPDPRYRRDTQEYMDEEIEKEADEMDRQKLGEGKDWWDDYAHDD